MSPTSPLSCRSESAGQHFTPALTPRHSLNQSDQNVWRWGSGIIIFRASGWFQCASRMRTAELEGWGRVEDGAASALGPGAWAAGGHVGWGGLGWRGVSDGGKDMKGKDEVGTQVGRASGAGYSVRLRSRGQDRLPRQLNGKEPACNAGDLRRPQLNSWAGKICWKKDRLPTLVFWPGEFYTVHGVAKSRTRLSDFHFLSLVVQWLRIHLLNRRYGFDCWSRKTPHATNTEPVCQSPALGDKRSRRSEKPGNQS